MESRRPSLATCPFYVNLITYSHARLIFLPEVRQQEERTDFVEVIQGQWPDFFHVIREFLVAYAKDGEAHRLELQKRDQENVKLNAQK